MAEDPEHLRVGPVEIRLERVVYATVVLMSVLAVYDGWAELTSFLGVAVVIVAPLVALGIAHLFSEAIEEHYHLQRELTGDEWRRLAVGQLTILVAAVPPLVVLGFGWVSPLDERSTIALLLWTGVVTLVILSLVAGRRAGIRGWRLAVAGLSGGVVGLLVISLQVLLKPH
jgi:hypothetical protein